MALAGGVHSVQAVTSSRRTWATRVAAAALAALAAAAAPAAAALPEPLASSAGVIAFTQGSTPHLWLMDVDSGERLQFTTGPRPDETAAWAPDGQRLAFADTRRVRVPGLSAPQITPLIAVLSVDSGSVKAITTGASFDEDPAWSPDGRRIALARTAYGGRTATYPEIWTMRTSGSGARRLTRNSVVDAGPAWSPDGARIAYGRLRRGTEDSWDVWVMRSDGTGQRRLVRGGTRPAWSPDGARIAYGRPKKPAPGDRCACARDLYVVDADGANRRRLAVDGTRPTWSPDGARIVFQRRTGAGSDLWIVNADGTGARRLTSGSGDEWAPAWRPR